MPKMVILIPFICSENQKKNLKRSETNLRSLPSL